MGKIISSLIRILFCLLIWAGPGMADPGKIAAQILDFNDKTFFNLTQSIKSSKESALIDMDFWGVAVNAPSRIKIKKHDWIPLVMAIRTSGERDWDIPLKKNCILVATNLMNGSIQFCQAFTRKGKTLSQDKERDPKPEGLAMAAAQLTELDPVGLMDMEWESGVFSFGVIHFDWPSNTVIVKLKGDKNSEPSPAIPVSPMPDPDTAANIQISRFLPSKETPPVPMAGLSFKLDVHMDGKTLVLNTVGSLSTRIKAFHLPDKRIAHQMPRKGKKENVSAIIPVTLALTGLNSETPIQFNWGIPVYGDRLKIGMKAKGFFTIERKLAADEVDPGRYASYIFMDGQIFGPQLIEINKN